VEGEESDVEDCLAEGVVIDGNSCQHLYESCGYGLSQEPRADGQ